MPEIFCVGGAFDGQSVETDPVMPFLAMQNPKTGEASRYELKTFESRSPGGEPEQTRFYFSVDLSAADALQRATDLNEKIRLMKGAL